MRYSQIITGILFSVLFSLFGETVQAGDIQQFKVDLPKVVRSGEEITITISGLDAKKKAITSDSRELKVVVANNGKNETKRVTLSRGKTTIKHTFPSPGAALISIVDVENPALADYKAFVVEMGQGVQK